MLCVLDFNGYFKLLHAAWESTLGVTREELMSITTVGNTKTSNGDALPRTGSGHSAIFLAWDRSGWYANTNVLNSEWRKSAPNLYAFISLNARSAVQPSCVIR
jgi:hypothetical protein